MMAQSMADSERPRGPAFKLDYPQRSDVPRVDPHRSDSTKKQQPLAAVHHPSSSGPGGVYAHATTFTSPQQQPAASPAVTSYNAAAQPVSAPSPEHTTAATTTTTTSAAMTPARSESTLSHTSRNQLVNPSYSPLDANRAAAPSDRPHEAFAMPSVASNGGVHAHSDVVAAKPVLSAPATPYGGTLSTSGTVGGDSRQRAVSTSTAGSAAAPVPLTATSLLERLEKYRKSGANGGDGSSLASSREQDALQRAGSLSSLVALPTSSAPFGYQAVTPPRGGVLGGGGGRRSTLSSYTGVSPSSVLRYPRSSQGAAAGTQSLAGGTRTAEVEARLQRAMQDKAHLEGKLEALTAECKLALKQRSELQQQLASSQARLEHQSGTAEAVGKREQQLREDLAELSEQLHEALQQNKAASQQGPDWSAVQEIQDQCKELQSSLEHLRQSSAEQQTENARLRGNLQSAQAETRQAEGERNRLASDMAAMASDTALLQESNNALQQQLHGAHSATDATRDELAAAHAAHLKLSVDLERERVAAAEKEAEMRQLQSQTLQQQGKILSSLEGFEADAAAREEALQRQANEKATTAEALEGAYKDAARECAELLRAQTQLKGQAQAAERQAAEFRQLAESAQAGKEAVQDEVTNLREHQLHMDRELELAAQALAGHEDATSALRTELYVAQQSAGMEQDARKRLEDDLERLRGNMVQLEDGLRQVQQEAEGREAEVDEERQRIVGEVDEERRRNAQREADLEDRLSRGTAEQRALLLRLGKHEQERDGVQADVDALNARQAQLSDDLAAARTSLADAERTALAAQRTATDANRRLEEERQHGETQLRTATATHAAELERALNGKVAAEADAERARHQLQSHQHGVEAELRAAVEAATLAHRQLQEQHRALVHKLAEAERQKERADHEAGRSAKRSERLQQEATALGRELASAENTRALAETELLRARQEAALREGELNDQIVALQEDLDEALHLQQSAREEAQALTNQLAEELERERGRVEGISSAQATLRDHAGTLEAELANREYSLGQLSSQTANVLAEKLAEDEAIGRKVQHLAAELEVAKEDNARLQQQLDAEMGREKASNSDLRRQMQQANSDAEQFADEVARLRQQLASRSHQEQRYEEAVAQSSMAIKAGQQEIDQLRRSLFEASSKDASTGEKLRTLSWQNEQLSVQVAALKEQSVLVETRHQHEADGLRQALSDADAATAVGSRGPLSTSSSLSLSKPSLSQQVSADSTDGPALAGPAAAVGGAVPAREVASLRGQLGRKHKTISGLQTCLSSLRGEMEKLQQQMARQTDAVQASNSTCRALESRLRGIKSGSTASLHRIGVPAVSPPLTKPEHQF